MDTYIYKIAILCRSVQMVMYILGVTMSVMQPCRSWFMYHSQTVELWYIITFIQLNLLLTENQPESRQLLLINTNCCKHIIGRFSYGSLHGYNLISSTLLTKYNYSSPFGMPQTYSFVYTSGFHFCSLATDNCHRFSHMICV